MDEEKFKDYCVTCEKVHLLCDNKSAIKIFHNPVQHNKMKHIEILHNFIRGHAARGDHYKKSSDPQRQIFVRYGPFFVTYGSNLMI
jgi:hypothetical protein